MVASGPRSCQGKDTTLAREHCFGVVNGYEDGVYLPQLTWYTE